jgi:ribonucleoside-diphosphate reductase alpha chain
MSLTVLKRNGKEEVFDIEKIHRVINWAVDGLDGVSASDVEINTKINLQDRASTKGIHKLLIESAANLISLETPNYQYVASRLLNYQLRKDVWGGKNPPRLYDFIQEKVAQKVYDPSILDKYSKEEISKVGEWIDHDRDLSDRKSTRLNSSHLQTSKKSRMPSSA